MAAAPSLTATFSRCRLGASGRAGGADCALIPAGGRGARAPTLTPAAPTGLGMPAGMSPHRAHSAPSRHPRQQPRERCAPRSGFPCGGVRWGERGGREEGGRGSSGESSKLKTDTGTFPRRCQRRSFQSPPWRAELRCPGQVGTGVPVHRAAAGPRPAKSSPDGALSWARAETEWTHLQGPTSETPVPLHWTPVPKVANLNFSLKHSMQHLSQSYTLSW